MPEDNKENAAIDALDAILAKVLVPLIKAKVPDADEAMVGKICLAVGSLFTDLGNGLAPV